MVPCGEFYCNGCGHQPPLSVSCPTNERAKGGDKWKSIASRPQPKATFAERQIQKAIEAKDKELAKAKQRRAKAKESRDAKDSKHVTNNP